MKLTVLPFFSFKNRFILILLLVFFILSGSLLVLNSSLIKGYLQSLMTQGISRDKSSASLWQEQSKIMIKFDLSDQEYSDALAFSRKLGVNSHWLESMSLELDSETTAKLQPLLPTTVSVDFSDTKVTFHNQRLPNLISSGTNSKYEFATRGASLKLYSNNQTKFQLALTQPAILLDYATRSGQLALSDKIVGIFPIASKIATIDLSVNGKNSRGEITLK